MYLMRLDDASEHMDIDKWKRIELILDKHRVKPIFGIIPHNADLNLLLYDEVDGFWELMNNWIEKGWTPAQHGYSHVYESKEGGINPVNAKSEFAGVAYEKQCQKIRDGNHILQKHGIYPEVFFAPSHTFDGNTLKALKYESNIRVISDTIANDVYYANEFYFVPQQSGILRALPFKLVTFCCHPNTMKEKDFIVLDNFLKKHNKKFISFDNKILKLRKLGIIDRFYRNLYFLRKKIIIKFL